MMVMNKVIKSYQWKGSNCKQSTRWQHISQLKANAFCVVGKINYCGLKHDYTWDWYCHLVGDRASLCLNVL